MTAFISSTDIYGRQFECWQQICQASALAQRRNQPRAYQADCFARIAMNFQCHLVEACCRKIPKMIQDPVDITGAAGEGQVVHQGIHYFFRHALDFRVAGQEGLAQVEEGVQAVGRATCARAVKDHARSAPCAPHPSLPAGPP